MDAFSSTRQTTNEADDQPEPNAPTESSSDVDPEPLPGADAEVAGTSSARCPVAIARSRNWLLTALDESVRTEEATLGRELDDAIGGLQRWREEQARRFEEMHRQASAELPVAPSAETEASKNSPPSCRSRARRIGSPNENACVPSRSTAATTVAARPAHKPAEPRPTAAERVALAEAAMLQQERVEEHPPDSSAGEMSSVWSSGLDECLRDMAEMERKADALREHASNLSALLAKLDVVEPREPPREKAPA